MSRRRTEHGQTLPLVSLCIVTLMVAAALGVDIGSLAVTNRRLQGIADLAAVDAARELTGAACNAPVSSGGLIQKDQVTLAAVDSAKRNGFVVGGDKILAVDLGTLTRPAADAGVPKFTALTTCTAADFPNAVQVKAGDRTPFSFGSVIGQGGRSSTRQGFASRGTALEGDGAFSLGSAFATVSSDRSTLLNPILNQMLCDPGACSMNVGALSYQGLVDSNITFGSLATQLGFGTTSELFTTDVKITRILDAAAVLVDPSTIAGARAATALGGISAAITGNQKIKLGDLVSANLINGNDAADVGLNLFQLVTGTAAIANGNNLVSIPNLAVTIPGVSSIGVSFSLIEAPVIIGKRPGATRTTKQLSLTITPQVNLSSGALAGLDLASITGALSIGISGGVAKGTLTGVRCSSPKGIDVNVVPSASSITTSGTLALTLSTSGTNGTTLRGLGGLLGIVVGGEVVSTSLSVSGTGASTATPAAGYDRSFAYPADFGPNGAQHVGNTTVGFGNLTYGTSTLTMSVHQILSILPITATVSTTVNSAAIASLLQPITSQIDTKLVEPLMDVLGLDLGAADIMATSLNCGLPQLG